jgi:hypothetical protein
MMVDCKNTEMLVTMVAKPEDSTPLLETEVIGIYSTNQEDFSENIF